jgi:hypothetical protein
VPQILSFGEVERILGRILQVAPERMPTLRARLKQWQKLDLPEGIKTGKGVRAEYGPEQVLQIAVLAKLLGTGMSLENAVLNVKRGWLVIKAQIVRALIAIALQEGPVYLTVSVDALAQLRYSEALGKLGVTYAVVGSHTPDLVNALRKSHDNGGIYDDAVFALEGVTIELTTFLCAVMDAMRSEGRYFGAWKEAFGEWFVTLEAHVDDLIKNGDQDNLGEVPRLRPSKFRQEAVDAIEIVIRNTPGADVKVFGSDA